MRTHTMLAAVAVSFFCFVPVHADEDWTADWLFKAAPEGAAASQPKQRMWRDVKRKLVILDGEICLRKGPLEMLACPRETKEYESLIVVDAIPGLVHRELVRVGAEPGSPTQFDPYKAASGTEIRIIVAWQDEDGKRHAVPAQQLIRHAKSGEAMKRTWVFAGSRFVEDPSTGQTICLADGGDFISVANFSTSMLDLPVRSPQENARLLYEPMTERVPPKKTKVRLVLVPQLED